MPVVIVVIEEKRGAKRQKLINATTSSSPPDIKDNEHILFSSIISMFHGMYRVFNCDWKYNFYVLLPNTFG